MIASLNEKYVPKYKQLLQRKDSGQAGMTIKKIKKAGCLAARP
jgi:hypothetical protein